MSLTFSEPGRQQRERCSRGLEAVIAGGGGGEGGRYLFPECNRVARVAAAVDLEAISWKQQQQQSELHPEARRRDGGMLQK